MPPQKKHSPKTRRVETRVFLPDGANLTLGDLRVAVFNQLLALRYGGYSHLQLPLSLKASKKNAWIAQLRWLGLPVAGSHGAEHGWISALVHTAPQEIYSALILKLLDRDRLYPCFCTPEELDRLPENAHAKDMHCAGNCVHLSETGRQKHYQAGRASRLRFRLPARDRFHFNDLVVGPVEYTAEQLGDFVVRDVQGRIADYFQQAVDDALLKVTHALKAQEPSLAWPKQVLMLQALDLPVPDYGHIPSVTPDDSGLSGLSDLSSVNTLRERGYHPQGILNYLARLGHVMADERCLHLEQLGRRFRISSLVTEPFRHDLRALDHWQQLASGSAHIT